jgi:hypothetical protein
LLIKPFYESIGLPIYLIALYLHSRHCAQLDLLSSPLLSWFLSPPSWHRPPFSSIQLDRPQAHFHLELPSPAQRHRASLILEFIDLQISLIQ